jgi:hypothetical protein
VSCWRSVTGAAEPAMDNGGVELGIEVAWWMNATDLESGNGWGVSIAYKFDAVRAKTAFDEDTLGCV